MDITVSKYDHQAGKDYCELTLTNDQGMQVKLLNYGATLEKILLPGDQGLENVILSLATPADYARERNFLGGTVGRIVGRVRRGQWQLGERRLQLPLNDGKNHAHGGQGTDTQVFSFQPEVGDRSVRVTFTLVDPDGANGYPGNLKMRVTYELDNQNQLTYRIQAVTDQMTVFNPTNHVYFNLDGPGTTVKEQHLKLASDYYLPLDAESLPYRGRAAVAGTVFDFRRGQRLGNVLDGNDPEIRAERGLNHPFMLSGRAPAVTLTSPLKNRVMQLRTTAPAVVVYTANHFAHTPGVTRQIGQHAGVAFEAQVAPQESSDLTPLILMPNEHFVRQTSWHFDF